MTAAPPPGPRVALFISGLDGGGAERVLINLGAELIRRGIGVDLVVVYADGPYFAQLDPGIRVVELGAKRLSTALPGLVGYLRRVRPTALLAALEDNNVMAVVAQAVARTPTRCVLSVHNHLAIEARYATRFRQRLAPVMARLLYRFADAVVAVSEGVAAELRDYGVPAASVHVVYNPIYSSELAAKALEPLDHPCLATGAAPVIVGVGRLARQKDYPTLLEAVALVERQRPVRLVLLGDGPERAALEAKVRSLDLAAAVTFIGFVANPYAWMARANLLVLSSIHEGFGNVLVEAMAVGTPVVSTDCPSGPAEILAHGRHGRLVPPGDPAALAGAIVATLDQPLPAAELRARAAVFSLERAVDAYLPLLGLAPPRPPASAGLCQRTLTE